MTGDLSEIQEKLKNRKLLYIAMTSVLIFGSAVLIIYNYQGDTKYIDKSGKEIKWSHPFFMGFIIALG